MPRILQERERKRKWTYSLVEVFQSIPQLQADICIASGIVSLPSLSLTDRCDTRNKESFARNPDRSWWHCHNNLIFLAAAHDYIDNMWIYPNFTQRRSWWTVPHWKDIVPQGFHKLTVAFCSMSPSQYGYFDVGTLFYSNRVESIVHDAWLTIVFLLHSVL